MVLFIIIILLSLILVAYMIFSAHHDYVFHNTVEHEKIPETFNNFSIFFIADIHKRKVRISTIQSVSEIDVVMIGGDLVEHGVSLEKMRQNIRALKKWEAPIYFVWGNNDYETDVEKMTAILKEEGVIILEDTIVPIYRHNEKINLIGLAYFEDEDEKHNVPWEVLDNKFTILLTHKPSAYYALCTEHKEKVDLILAGHTHGGQIRLWKLGLYERGGISDHKNSVVLTTEGYGYTLLPFRLGTRSSCHVITLCSSLS